MGHHIFWLFDRILLLTTGSGKGKSGPVDRHLRDRHPLRRERRENVRGLRHHTTSTSGKGKGSSYNVTSTSASTKGKGSSYNVTSTSASTKGKGSSYNVTSTSASTKGKGSSRKAAVCVMPDSSKGKGSKTMSGSTKGMCITLSLSETFYRFFMVSTIC